MKVEQQKKEITGAILLLDALKENGVEVVFGYPGGQALPLYDAIYDYGIKHILTRHEQGAIHAAEGYARISGKPGVVITTSGPGATNILTGLADAYIDSTPLVVLTCQVPTDVIGTDAFQEADMIGLTMPVTKHNYQVREVKTLKKVITEAFHIASTGRKGPVVIDLPKDLLITTTKKSANAEIDLPGYQPTYHPNALQINRLKDAIANSIKPVVVAGGGIILSDASNELREFCKKYNLPVIHTLMGLGGFDPDNELYLGMGGMHGEFTANTALCECDLLISIGARFDDRFTGAVQHFATNAKIAHIDIDPAEIGKIIKTDIPIVADAKNVINEMLKEPIRKADDDEWVQYLIDLRKENPIKYDTESADLKPQAILQEISDLTNGEAVFVTDVGQNQMWAAQFLKQTEPNRWATSGGLGTMGYGLPAAIGAQIAAPDKKVFAILGDGGLQMTVQELATIKDNSLPIKIILLNNSVLGMVRQWQTLFYKERYSHSVLSNPDFELLSKAYGLDAIKLTDAKDMKETIKKVVDYDGPIVVNCIIDQDEMVYPIVAPGAGLHEMKGV